MDKSNKRVISFNLSEEAIGIIKIGSAVTKCKSDSAFVDNVICSFYNKLDPEKEIVEIKSKIEQRQNEIVELEIGLKRADERKVYFLAVKENRDRLRRSAIDVLKRKMLEETEPLELEHMAMGQSNKTGIPYDELLAQAKQELDNGY